MKINFSYLNYFRPNLFLKSIQDINVYSLKRSGIKYVFCDLDNTLVPHFTSLPTSMCFQFVNLLKQYDIKMIIISNNSKERVERFCDNLDITDFIYKANKPFTRKIKKMMKKYAISNDDVIFIGDQFVTDIWVANRLGIKSILLLPIVDSISNNFSNIITYLLDKLIYRYIAHENLLNSNDNMIKENYDYI